MSVPMTAKNIVAIVSYDYDYGWICEQLNNGEYEMTSRSLGSRWHSEAGRRDALREALLIAKERGGRVMHYYEYPKSVRRKHRKHRQLCRG